MNFDFNLIWKWTMSLLPPKMDSTEAKAMVLAIGFQESKFEHRRQMNDGPARGYWQFEQGGGVRGVLNHPATERYIKVFCQKFDIPWYPLECWNAIEYNDVLACAFARLLLLTAPWSLPGPTAVEEGWKQYLWCWRPGMPRRDDWPDNFIKAWQLV